MPDTDGADFSAWGLLGQVGFIVIIALGIGLAVGLGLDRVFGTKPVLTLVGVTIGFALGIATVYRVATQAAERAQAVYQRSRKGKPASRPVGQDDDDD